MEDVLLLVHRIPFPPNKGDKIRSYRVLKHLARDHRVHLGAFVDDPEDWAHGDAVRALAANTCLVGLEPRRARLGSARGLATGEALTLPYYRSAQLARWVRDTLAKHPIRQVVVFSSAMAQYVMDRPDLTRVMDFVDVDSDKWRQYAASKAWPMSWIYGREARALLAFERRVAREFDASFFVSAEEAGLFRQLAPESAARIGHFQNGVDADYFSPGRDYPDPYPAGVTPLVFTGAMDYWANVDAVLWFAREVFPGLRERRPDLAFYIVGSRPAPEVTRLAEMPGVVVTGTVPDVRPYIAHGRVSVAPLRISRGIQNKVLEAMAMARPVVASPQAAEGINARLGEDLRVAAEPADFAREVEALLAGGATAMGAAARARVLENYDWTRNLDALGRALERRHDAASGASPVGAMAG